MTLVDNSLAGPATRVVNPGNNTHDIPTRPVPLFAMLGESMAVTPEPYVEIEASPAHVRDEDLPDFEKAPIARVPAAVLAPVASAVEESRQEEEEHDEAESEEEESVEAESGEEESVEAPRAGAARASPRIRAAESPEADEESDVASKVVLSAEDSLLSHYPPVSPVRRALTRFVTRVAVLGALAVGAYFARPYVVSRIPTWPQVVDRVVRPTDKWLRHLPMRFAPGRLAPPASPAN